MAPTFFTVTSHSVVIFDAENSILAELQLAFVVDGTIHRVKKLLEVQGGWTGLGDDPNITVSIRAFSGYLSVELCGPFEHGMDVTYFHGSKVTASHVHAFVPDENLGAFPTSWNKTFTLTNQAAMRQRLGLKEELWMIGPQPHVFAVGDYSGRGFSFSIPECLPVDAVQFVIRDQRMRLDFLHYVAACDKGRMPRVYIDVGNTSDRCAIHKHVEHAQELGLMIDKPFQPKWWHNPLYCTWGDQCWLGQNGIKKDESLTVERILGWADVIRSFYSGDVNLIIDDGYFMGMGDFRLRPELYPSIESFTRLIVELKKRNFRVILWYTPFWVDKHARVTRDHPEWLLHGHDGKLLDETGDWKGKYHFDWTHPEVRDWQRGVIRYMLSELDADGFKIDMTYACPPTRDTAAHDQYWGAGNQLCKRVVEFLHTEATKIKPDVFLTISGVECYLQPYASAVRLNDLFNFSDATAWYRRAELVLAVMPGVAIDVDGWPGALVKLREYPFVSGVFGAPVTYYLEGTDVGGVALGLAERNRTAAIWNTYGNAPVEQGQQIAVDIEGKIFERRDPNGALRAISYAESIFITFNETVRVAVNKDTAVSVPLERGLLLTSASRVNLDGSRSPIPLHIQADRVLFFAEDSAEGILYYELF